MNVCRQSQGGLLVNIGSKPGVTNLDEHESHSCILWGITVPTGTMLLSTSLKAETGDQNHVIAVMGTTEEATDDKINSQISRVLNKR